MGGGVEGKGKGVMTRGETVGIEEGGMRVVWVRQVGGGGEGKRWGWLC